MITTDTIDMTPTWEAAVRIYCAVLKNPNASLDAQHGAQEDLLRLARAFDKLSNPVLQKKH